MKLLLLALALGCNGALLQEVCQPHSRPLQVYKGGWYGEGRCSGALINEWWVLTAWNFVEKVFPFLSFLKSVLAMVKLAEPAWFTQHVMPVAIPTRCTQLHEKCLVSGWGSTRVIDDKMCQIAFPLYWIEHTFCAKTIISTDNCLSDQGSTVVCEGELKGLFWSGSSDVGLYTRLRLYPVCVFFHSPAEGNID
uniref:Peptidase S1 domain-containing protein n=1 Tax=Oncorhynchus tshawytscha TaxID=74940 RepID=A0AAZ3Q445_ONCTS